MFYVFHTRYNKSTKRRMDYTWKYWTNDVHRVIKWFNGKSKPWRKPFKQGTSATALYILTPDGPQLIKMLPATDYATKSYITGRAFWETNQRVLPKDCFSRYASKRDDLAIYNSAGQAVSHKYYKGHKSSNYSQWKAEMKK